MPIDWLTKFFSMENKLNFHDGNLITNDTSIQTALNRILVPANANKFPAILPRLTPEGNYLFYVLTNSFTQQGDLLAILNSWFGRTYFNFVNVSIDTSNCSIDRLLLQVQPTGFVRLDLHDRFSADSSKPLELIENFNKVLNLYYEKPVFKSDAKRPVGRVLRDFFSAVSFGDGTAALAYKDELKMRRLMSPLNLLSLEFQALDASSEWHGILDDKRRLLDAVAGMTSWKVQSIILRALRATSLSPHVIECHSSDDIVKKYNDIQALFFKDPGLPHDPSYYEEWMSWSIGASAFGFDGVFKCLPQPLIDDGWDEKLRSWISPETAVVGWKPNQKSSETRSSVPSLAMAQQLLQEALASGSIERRQKIYDEICNYPESILESLKEDRFVASFWAGMQSQLGATRISNWVDVIELVAKGTPIEDIQDQVLNAVVKWDVAHWDGKALSVLINEDKVTVLRDILPVLLEWLSRHEILLTKRDILSILLNLASDESRSIQDLGLCAQLIRSLVSLPISQPDYIEGLDYIQEVWAGDNGAQSRVAVDYYLDVFDIIADALCPAVDRREKLWSEFQGFLIEQWPKLHEIQQLSALELAEDLVGCSDQFPIMYAGREGVQVTPSINLAGKKLAIYSLTESAARRAASVLVGKYPGLKVDLNHDKTATSALINLADKSDYFVFSSRSAAHQAYYPVADRRKDLIYPSGKGFTSIVRAFVERIELAA